VIEHKASVENGRIAEYGVDHVGHLHPGKLRRQNTGLSRVSNEVSRQQPRLLVTASMSRRLLS
jgi:hypothetical protein